MVKHLQALADAGLAASERDGREVKYAATPERLATVVAWLTESSTGWDRRTSRLDRRCRNGLRPTGTGDHMWR